MIIFIRKNSSIWEICPSFGFTFIWRELGKWHFIGEGIEEGMKLTDVWAVTSIITAPISYRNKLL